MANDKCEINEKCKMLNVKFEGYSYLNASIGLKLAARLAG